MDQHKLPFSEGSFIDQSNDQKEIIALLKKQNQLLENMIANSSYGLVKDDDRHFSSRTRVIDINMSIGAMVSFMLKWMVATIPVALIIGALWLLVMVVLMALGMSL